MPTIKTSGPNQFEIEVDEEDYGKLASRKWWICRDSKTGYIHGTKDNKGEYIHFAIMGRPSNGLEWDHRDGNRLNNKKSNLRLATSSQNKANRGPRKDNKCGYKGVRWKNAHGWEARVHKDDKDYFLGYYNTPEQAAKVYDAKAKQLFGEFAYTNFAEKQ